MGAGRDVQIVAVASAGGHLEELLEMRQAWAGYRCMYVTTSRDAVDILSGERVAIVTDCHKGQIARTIACSAQIVALLLRTRPGCIVSTGALPGLLAALVGRALGARVIWVDSVANAGELSACGRWARPVAHSHFTQWPLVAAREKSEYLGSLF